MFDTLFIITLFLVASLLVCLLTLRLSININYFYPPHPHPPTHQPRLLNLTKISNRPVYFDSPPRLLAT